jgi:hypothetical protein
MVPTLLLPTRPSGLLSVLKIHLIVGSVSTIITKHDNEERHVLMILLIPPAGFLESRITLPGIPFLISLPALSHNHLSR